MSIPPQPTKFYNSNYTWRRFQIMQLLVMQLSPPSYILWQLWIHWISSSGKTTRGGALACGMGVGLRSLAVENKLLTIELKENRTWKNSYYSRLKRRNMDMRFGTWDIRSLCWPGSITTVSRELSRYRLDLVGVQEVRWEGSGTVPAGEYTFCIERGMRTMNWV
jgi:hypothetical protein